MYEEILELQNDPRAVERVVQESTKTHNTHGSRCSKAKRGATRCPHGCIVPRAVAMHNGLGFRLSGAVAEHLNAGQLESLFENDPRLGGYFIQGQTAFLSENVQPERRVSNGTEVVFDSLILGGESSEMEAREDEDGDIEHGRFYEQVIADAKPGSVVTIHRPPFAVNVRLPGRTPCEFSDCNVDSTGNGVVVPITEMKKTTQLTCFLPGVGKLPGITVNSHGVEPSSSATCYKAQGRTMPRVLADLGNPPDKQPWTFEALFVFLSRVR